MSWDDSRMSTSSAQVMQRKRQLWLLALLLFAVTKTSAQLATGTIPPRKISGAEPAYSEEARRAAVASTVTVSLIVNTDGIPQNVKVTRGAGFGLDEKAVEAVTAWRFVPATKQGVPVAFTASIETNFRLLGPAPA